MTPRGRIIVFVGIALAIGVAVGSRFRGQPEVSDANEEEECGARVTKEELERSVAIGTQFMIAHQKPAGNFDYEYDWKTKQYSNDDNSARQSGALWGLSLLHAFAGADKASPELEAALGRGLAYFDDASRTTQDGWRYPVYPAGEDGGADGGATGSAPIGTAALVTLAVLDYVRSLPASDQVERPRWAKRADEYVGFLATSIRKDGTWPGEYRFETGAGAGAHSPYSDGEALLALVTAMKYHGRDDLRPVILRAAIEGHRVNVEQARAKNADSATTKGYYQWSSMAYYELATSAMGEAPDAPPYGEWLMDLADWIIDVHRIVGRPRNTGYAYEGIVSALAWAKAKKDPRADKLACTTHRGLSNLLGWQVGHPRADKLGATDDPKAVGGVQNHATESPLRIDVVQHQMHATMLAIEHLF
ncbi:MAG: hypothetical protein KIT84_19965 [Labilithrix sp.]|nr:hypothetical protein [Labilithrix sp.]MCW5813315.1 hypothetical protein [Labilithrix sp.]